MSNTYLKSRQSNDIISETSVSFYRFGLELEPDLTKTLWNSLSEAGLGVIHSSHEPCAIVPIASFSAPPRMEDTLSRWTQRICSNFESTEIEFNNFSGLPPHTIYLRIQDASPIKQMMGDLRKLDLYLTGNGHEPLHAVHRFMLPVIENIEESKYDNLMYRFGRMGFHGKAQIKSMILQQFKGNGWKDLQQFSMAQSILKL
jgi:hypothetical protein